MITQIGATPTGDTCFGRHGPLRYLSRSSLLVIKKHYSRTRQRSSWPVVLGDSGSGGDFVDSARFAKSEPTALRSYSSLQLPLHRQQKPQMHCVQTMNLLVNANIGPFSMLQTYGTRLDRFEGCHRRSVERT